MRAGARLTASGVAALAAAGGAGAQAPSPAGAAPAAPAACTYDACALRRERVFFSERILAGARGAVAARPRFGGAFPIDSIVRSVPEALPEARRYRREQVRGQLLSLAGGVLSLAAVIDAVNRSGGDCDAVGVGPVVACSNGWRARSTALVLGGLAFSVTGGWRLQIADRSLNRAIWWYNRALPR